MLWIFVHIIIFFLGILVLQSWPRSFLGNGLAEGIGGSLIATSAAGISLFLYVHLTNDLKERLDAISSSGLVRIFPFRSVLMKPEYDARLKRATRIDVVGFGLSAFRQDYSSQFAEWSRRAVIRVVLIDPEFPTPRHSIADIRDAEEGHASGQTATDVSLFVEAFRNLDGIEKDKFQLRLTRTIPAINMLRINDEIFWGPYLMQQQSRNTPTLLVDRSGYLFEVLEKHFEALWTNAIAMHDVNKS